MLRLAHTYARPDLKQHLEGCLARRLSLENFTGLAELAHFHEPCPILMSVGAPHYSMQQFTVLLLQPSHSGVCQIPLSALQQRDLLEAVAGDGRDETEAGVLSAQEDHETERDGLRDSRHENYSGAAEDGQQQAATEGRSGTVLQAAEQEADRGPLGGG